MSWSDDGDYQSSKAKAILIDNLKRQVKRVMEESATRRQLSGDGYSVKILALVIETCLQHGLLKESRFKSAARWLLDREASEIDLLLLRLSKLCPTNEQIGVLVHSDYFILQKMFSSPSLSSNSTDSNENREVPDSNGSWVRFALTNHLLYETVKILIDHSKELYEPTALMRNPIGSELFISLIAGPCVLNYESTETLFSSVSSNEPDAKELTHRRSLGSKCFDQKHFKDWNSEEDDEEGSLDGSLGKRKRRISLKSVVQSLYQTDSDRIVYARNNVKVESRHSTSQAGHLSILKSRRSSKLKIQWIPNILMLTGRTPSSSVSNHANQGLLSVNLLELSHIYVKQRQDDVVVTLVDRSGVQLPNIWFESARNSDQFLFGLETGLADIGGRLVKRTMFESEDTSQIYRIVAPAHSETTPSTPMTPATPYGLDDQKFFRFAEDRKSLVSSVVVRVIDQVETEILHNVFSAWRSYAQRLTRLRRLCHRIFGDDPRDDQIHHNEQFNEILQNADGLDRLFSCVYFNGVPDEADKKLIWPIMLGHYAIRDNEQQRNEVDRCSAVEYSKLKNEWTLALNAATPSGDFPCDDNDDDDHNNFTCDVSLIHKDVIRCDRQLPFFKNPDNLEKLRQILCTYIWTNRSLGYVQGMCDVLAPLLTVLEDESLAFSCFRLLMERLNFRKADPCESMNWHFDTLELLIEWLDADLYGHVKSMNDSSASYYFTYRWFLLDFKREFKYDEVFRVWECIWASEHTVYSHFPLFVAAALIVEYRDVIIDNMNDLADILRFFNEMAEQHNTQSILLKAKMSVEKLRVAYAALDL